MNVENPKVFISYSWGNSITQESVMELAQRLMNDGVEVVLDKWDFQEGHDKYAFMERTVSDESIDHVLIICDKSYQERADSRKGGVGDETVVISSEVYGHIRQTKFIPLIFERDSNGEAFMPAYIKSKKYIDFSNEDEYEKAYEELLRVLYGMSINKKPKLGKKPEWLSDNEVNYSKLTLFTKALKRGAVEQFQKYNSICTEFIDAFVSIANEFRFREDKFNEEELLKKISSLKSIRDEYFDFLGTVLKSEFFSTDLLTDFFEKMYNNVGNAENGAYNDKTFEYYAFLRWESFIGTIAILFHYEKYAEIYKVLNHTYFLRDHPMKSSRLIPCKFTKFSRYLQMLDFDCQKILKSNYLSYPAQLLSEREKLPILNKQNIAETDLILYQLSTIFISEEEELLPSRRIWFPYMYAYVKREDLWVRLKSRAYCQKIFPLFGVKTIDELKILISKATYNSSIHYGKPCFESAPNILSHISLEQIGILN